MNDRQTDQDAFRAFQLMNELEGGETVSQRELASRLGIAVGLVNSYLKNFIAKGYIRVKNYPRNRYVYLLTPKGLAEKSRLAYQHLNYFNTVYKTARKDYLKLFISLSQMNINKVIFCGTDEVAEIAFLSLKETNIEMKAVFSEKKTEDLFFNNKIRSLEEVRLFRDYPIIITASKNREKIYRRMCEMELSNPIYCPGLLPMP